MFWENTVTKRITVRDEITGGLILIFLVGRRGASRVRMMFGLIHHHFSFLEEETLKWPFVSYKWLFWQSKFSSLSAKSGMDRG